VNDDEWHKWFQGVWEDREENLYRKFFGELDDHCYKLKEDIFADNYGMDNYEPSWLTNVVIESPPSAIRNNWLYVTSGLSNPIGCEPDKIKEGDFSGMGFEMIIETQEQVEWPIDILHNIIAYQILVATSHVEGNILDYSSIMPFENGVADNSTIDHMVIIEPTSPSNYPSTFSLSSGAVDFFLLFGMTSKEVSVLSGNEEVDLIERFQGKTSFPITEINRDSVV